MNNPAAPSSRQYRVLLAWELGSNFGHLFNFKYIATALQEASMDVLVAAKELHHSEKVLKNSGIKLIQAPVWLPKEKRPFYATCVPDLLLHRGYDSVDGLMALVKAWQTLFDLYRPDLVLFDYAPTALLAAKNYPFRKISFGVGFGVLTPGALAEAIVPLKGKEIKIRAAENLILKSINDVLGKMDVNPLNFVGDLFATDSTLITTIPELDIHGANRKCAEYIGPLYNNNDELPEVSWPVSKYRHNIFIYLNTSNRNLKTVLLALPKVKANIVVYIGGSKEAFPQRPAENIYFSNTAVNLNLLKSADLVIVDGGQTVGRSILAGVPVLVAPGQLEQRTIALLGEKTGATSVVRYSDDKDSLADKINFMLSHDRYKSQARKLAEKYSHLNGPSAIENIKQTCIKLLNEADN